MPNPNESNPDAVRRALETVHETATAAAVAALDERSRSTLATVVTHASVRRFEPDPVPDDVIAALEAALVRGPTSSALHSYSHVLVRDPARKRLIAGLAGDQRWIDDAPLLIVGCADLRRAREIVHARGYTYTAHDLRMLISATADLTVGLQNASLVAQSLGFGTVLLGGVLNGSLEIARTLDLPSRVVPLVGLSVGRPADGHWPAPRPRLPLPLLVHHERWSLDDDAERALLAAHDAETCARGDFESRRIAWAAMGRGGDDPIAPGAYGVLEHIGRKQGRATWGPQGAKVDVDLPAQGLRVRSTGDTPTESAAATGRARSAYLSGRSACTARASAACPSAVQWTPSTSLVRTCSPASSSRTPRTRATRAYCRANARDVAGASRQAVSKPSYASGSWRAQPSSAASGGGATSSTSGAVPPGPASEARTWSTRRPAPSAISYALAANRVLRSLVPSTTTTRSTGAALSKTGPR